jgi:hypothetical protein
MNERKPDWGWIAGGAMMLLLGGVSLWKAWLAFAYHMPIYSKGPSWMSPWQALVAGVLCLGLGLVSIISAVPRKIEK